MNSAHSQKAQAPQQAMPLGLALTPVAVLIALLVTALALFGDGAIGGPTQLCLMLAGCAAGGVGMVRGVAWEQLEAAVGATMARASMPIMILLAIGGLIGVWMAAGIIPALIVYGSQILNPEIFYLAALLISALVALVVGSSWTTAGTVGIALIGVAAASGLSLPMTAGAIISGVYFGDKLSPLSDTTNLAAALAGTPLFTHVRYLLWTTVPALGVAIVFFAAASFLAAGEADTAGLAELSAALGNSYTISAWLLLPFLGLFTMAYKGVPALLAILASIVIGGVFGAVFQQHADPQAMATLGLYWGSAANGYAAQTGLALADDLLSRGGMDSMLTTVWLIVSAMFFSGMMERSGCLQRLLEAVLRLFQKGQSILFGAGATAMLTNVVAGDQYVSLVIASRMYAGEVEARGLAPETLSRTSEDFGTVTSVLVPWNTCGAYMAATLGVATWAYLPFCIFNLASPVISAWYIASGRSIRWHRQDSRHSAPEPAQS
nr:Na+/H+ antiporter NhaC [Oceanococcus sp. HetDA_MAG_MS8]